MSFKDKFNAVESLISSQAKLSGYKSIDFKLSRDTFGNIIATFTEGKNNLEVKFSEKEVNSILLNQPQESTINKVNNLLIHFQDTGNKGPGYKQK